MLPISILRGVRDLIQSTNKVIHSTLGECDAEVDDVVCRGTRVDLPATGNLGECMANGKVRPNGRGSPRDKESKRQESRELKEDHGSKTIVERGERGLETKTTG